MTTMQKQIAHFIERLPGQTKPVVMTLVYGLSAGLIAVLFQMSISLFNQSLLVRLSHASLPIFLVGSFITIISTSLLVGYLLNEFCRDAIGSGIPQLKLAFWKNNGFVSWRVVWVKFLAGVLSIGGGSSLGREGPSVQLAAGLASNFAGVMGEAKESRKLAAAAGAGAGMAAAFNTPLAAVTFVLEEIIGDLNSRLLGSVLFASIIGAFVAHGLIGKQPAFSLSGVDSPKWFLYLLVPIVAVGGSLIGVYFQKWILRLRSWRISKKPLPSWSMPAVGGLVTWCLGVTVFIWSGHLGVFGLGYEDLSSGLNHQIGWHVALILLMTKLVATIFCYSLGGCGGVFTPTLFLGGMFGIVFSGIGSMFLPLSLADQLLLAVVGMSTCLSAVVRAPVTGILLVFEMTHEFSLVPALMLGTLISQAISRKMNKLSFYDSLLVQDGEDLEKLKETKSN